ncbi:MAG: DUF488 family protein [Dehalococcoidia bacterium]|nr:DUF488 family protein [Dehalococcoidia bacterium]
MPRQGERPPGSGGRIGSTSRCSHTDGHCPQRPVSSSAQRPNLSPAPVYHRYVETEPSTSQAQGGRLFTIGHSNLGLDDVLRALGEYAIEELIDVRSQPYSRFVPRFNRPDLAHALGRAGVGYSYMGDSLGGRPDDPSCYDARGHVLYGAVARKSSFQGAIAWLRSATEARRIALLCAEEEPAECHRHLLIARVLAGAGFGRDRIVHLKSDGGATGDDEIPTQAALFPGEDEWKSPRSALRKARRSTSSDGSERAA